MEVLAPGVKDGQKTNRGSHAVRVSRNREQRLRRCAEQNAINLSRILKRQHANLLRQRKDNVEVGDRQQFGLPLCQPCGARHRLTLWAMPVAA